MRKSPGFALDGVFVDRDYGSNAGCRPGLDRIGLPHGVAIPGNLAMGKTAAPRAQSLRRRRPVGDAGHAASAASAVDSAPSYHPVEASMIGTFVPLRRITALSVAITLFATPIASAQSLNAAPPAAAPTNTALLRPAAFARLLQPPPADAAPAPVVKAPPRLDLLHHGTTAMARQAQAAPTKAPQQKGWVSRHKVLTGILIGVGAFCGVVAVVYRADLG